jgi:hypothetical protein
MRTWEDDVEVHALRTRGWTIAAIARHTGAALRIRDRESKPRLRTRPLNRPHEGEGYLPSAVGPCRSRLPPTAGFLRFRIDCHGCSLESERPWSRSALPHLGGRDLHRKRV